MTDFNREMEFVSEAVNEASQAFVVSSTELFFILLSACIVVGILAVLGGVGGGVIFTPLMMCFTPVDSFIIRATGLLVAMAGSLVAARPFLLRGLANTRLIFFAAVPYSVLALMGALLAGYVRESSGDIGDAWIRLSLGIIIASVSALLLFWGKRVEYPEVNNVDRFTERLHLEMSYWEASMFKVVDYKLRRAPVGIILFCFVGFISGFFGLGAGWAMVPAFNLVMLSPIKVAAASSKVLIGIGDTAAVWSYIMSGGIFPLFATPCVIGVVVGTYIGAKIMLKVRAGFIRYLIIAVLFGSGAKLILDGIQKLG